MKAIEPVYAQIHRALQLLGGPDFSCCSLLFLCSLFCRIQPDSAPLVCLTVTRKSCELEESWLIYGKMPKPAPYWSGTGIIYSLFTRDIRWLWSAVRVFTCLIALGTATWI